MIFFLVSCKENEIITGLRVFLSVKRRRLPWVVVDDMVDDMMYDDVQTMRKMTSRLMMQNHNDHHDFGSRRQS